MDETDLRLIYILILDSRTPYSVLARRLKLSVPAVHQRVAVLRETGVVTKFTANLSGGFLNAVPVYCSGVSEAFPLRKAIETLGKNDFTNFVITGSGNWLHLYALLPRIQDLEPYVDFLQKGASMPNPHIGIVATVGFGSSPPQRVSSQAAELDRLDRLDYRILLALHDDARKSIADVSDEIHASPKTVRNRLRRMTERGEVEFSIEAQPGVRAGVSAFLPISLKPGVDIPGFRGRLMSDLEPWIVWANTFSNAPNSLTLMTWSPTPEAHEDLVNRISSYEGVERLAVHVASHYDFFETWRDKLLKKRAALGRT